MDGLVISFPACRLLCLLFGGTVRKNRKKSHTDDLDGQGDAMTDDQDQREDSEGSVPSMNVIMFICIYMHDQRASSH